MAPVTLLASVDPEQKPDPAAKPAQRDVEKPDWQMLKAFGEKLHERMVARSFSATKLAHELEIRGPTNYKTVTAWMDGKANFSVSRFKKLCVLLDMHADDALGLEPSEPLDEVLQRRLLSRVERAIAITDEHRASLERLRQDILRAGSKGR